MSTRVINAGHWERTTSGARNTNLTKSFSGEGQVNAVWEGVTYSFGPGESKVLEDGIAAGVIAFDSRLRIADTRDGVRTDVN